METQPSPIRLYLVRHAEVEERYQEVFGGRIDMVISPHGRTQSEALAAYFKEIPLQAVYASPMKRVQKTLEPLLRYHPVGPVTVEDFREVDFGVWTGLRWHEVTERFGIPATAWLDELEGGKVEEAECPQAWRERVERGLQTVVEDSRRARHQHAAIYCHGGVIRMLLAILFDLRLRQTAGFEIDYASVSIVDYYSAERRILKLLNLEPWRAKAVLTPSTGDGER